MSETIDDIVCEMRKDMPRVVDTKVILRNYADRIEAAVKHQFRETTKTIPHEKVGVRDAANNELLNSIKSYQINSSKARKALEEIMAYVADMVCRSERNESLRKAIYNSARYALSAPPRNCDKCLTPKDAMLAHLEEVFEGEKVEFGDYEWCEFVKWLFADAKGENK
jgi:hypothetical protein